jgi:hypothetical protein
MNHKNMIQAKDEPKDDDGVMAETPEPESESEKKLRHKHRKMRS